MKNHNKKLNNNKMFLILGIIIAITTLLFMTGCSSGGTSANKKYYTGYDSIDMKFSGDTPPAIFYYDSESDENEIPIVLEVKNKGASDSYGALYISGYDTHFISLAGDVRPNSGHIRITNDGLDFGFTIAGVYIGFSGHSGSQGLNVGFKSPNGITYGADAFSQDGTLKGINIRISGNRIGSELGKFTLAMFSKYVGYNSIIALEGDTPETPNGGMEVYEFPAYIYDVPASLETFQQPFLVTACYDYVTHSTSMVCVDPKPNTNVKKVCKPGTTTLSGGQGAPVAITSIEQQAGSKKTVFTIHIKHQRKTSTDDLYDYFSLYKCDPKSGETVRLTDKNVVYVGRITLSGIPLQCMPDNKIRLDEQNNGQISCTAYFDGAAETAYQAPLEIELWYGYSKSIQKTITIKKI